MGKRLAIRGHSTRGKEVIELLEMIGGSNIHNLSGCNDCVFYVNDGHQNIIRGSAFVFGDDDIHFLHFFTLEEFLTKYPFKVRDKVIDDSGESGVIIEMKWDEEIIYKVDFGKECYYFASDYLRPYKETNVNEIKPLFKAGDVVKLKGDPDENLFWIIMDVIEDGYIFNDGEKCSFDDQHHYEKSNREVINTQPSKMKNVLAELLEHIKTTPKEELEREFEEIKEWSNVGPTIEEFMTFCECVNKPKYPTTYDECYDEGNTELHFIYVDKDERDLYESFIQLIRCRNAYWKIAGEEIGLGKPWEPDWNDDDEDIFCIYNVNGTIYSDGGYPATNKILVFPTEEMRDAFYENFKDLIEACKELL